ncbi:diacylglycerol/lipid kinase family protein [Bombilactobacillus thymidiniphilus]|uniref:YegS/Rv2252/BmrU family lipid kinase n=1 Tax=Bombilactobacillus thymidiniphilus TaxID=2923363 RepID=A0ABY4PEP8_9LACO|nr:YegS/Rv2252/BmrU family lipid kinase [Bombilactobacillus thymidiniphilus]UQS83772.1 YegS/Rv2252/BmrU family lipid kinase [Bombilactobacillus thymidiniphilus]
MSNKNKQFIVVVNLFAGGGQARQTLNKTIAFFKRQDINYKINFTPKMGATKLVCSLVTKLDPQKSILLIIGGDGTLNQAINGVQQSQNSAMPLAYLPAGSGNDFARALHIKAHQEQQLLTNLLKSSKPQALNLGKITSPVQADRFFINYFGIGLDAAIVHYANRSKIKKYLNKLHLNKLIYIMHLFKALKEPAFDVEITANQQVKTFQDVFVCIIGNEPYCGGGIKLLPNANPKQTALQIALADKVNLPQLLKLVVQVFFTGNHLNNPLVHHTITKDLTLSLAYANYGQVDGEELAHQAYHINISCAVQNFWL